MSDHNSSNKKWTRSPKHILRLNCLLDLISKDKPCRFLEVGAGTGDFTSVFLERGYLGTCYDISNNTRKILCENLKPYGDKVFVADTLAEFDLESFDALLAFEVLEHVENDQHVLYEWASYLRKGGRLLVSVPAHMRKFSKEDARVGHVRRYEKSELVKLISESGFDQIKVYNYGFPLGNLTRRISSLFSNDELKKDDSLTMEQRTIKSGVERSDSVNKYSYLFNRFTMFPFIVFQRMFYNSDLGDGYVVAAIKK